MKTLTILLMIAVLSGTSPASVSDDNAPFSSTNDPPVPITLLHELLHWIDGHTDYDVSAFLDQAPTVRFCQRGEQILYEGKTLKVEQHLRGLYDKPDSSIILVKPWDASSPTDVSTLLHELIHMVQYHHKDWLCWQRTEWEAYKLQDAWLKERGLDPHFNWLQIQMLSNCNPHDIHPAMDPLWFWQSGDGF